MLWVRESRFGGTEFSIDTKLNEVITEQLAISADAQFQSQMAGYQAQQQQAAQPTKLPQRNQMSSRQLEGDEQGILPPNRGDTHFDSAEGLRIRVTHRVDDVVAGPLVGPDGQRIDSGSAAARS